VITLILTAVTFDLKDMILKNKIKVKKSSNVRKNMIHSPPSDISKKNVTMAFALIDSITNEIYDLPNYGTFLLEQVFATTVHDAKQNLNVKVYNRYQIPFSKCKIGKNIFYDSPEELESMNI
jgi:hypothetical protein